MLRPLRRLAPVLLLLVCASCAARQRRSDDPLYAAFREPTPQHRPFVRWWWNGARVDQTEILRELDVMKDSGIGGVEINTIAMADGASPESLAAFPARPWLSPEWNELVRVAAAGAHARGMSADLIVGSGWPFGGMFLTPGEQIQRVRVIKRVVEGPAAFDEAIDSLVKTGRRLGDEAPPASRKVIAARLLPQGSLTGTFTHGTDIALAGQVEGRLRADVPAGSHVLYAVVEEIGFSHVKLGAPGADGPVVDHFNASAVRKYLEHLSSRLGPALGGKLGSALRAMFVDSLELDHSNWTGDFVAEFARRRGYALAPYLPFVLDGDLGRGDAPFEDTVRRARQDFSRTLVELFHERFLATYVRWCEDNGLRARIQAYGRETHPLEGSMLPHLPEGETWLWPDPTRQERLMVESTSVNKYVSSAAHLTGKPLVSFEAMTSAVAVFRETLDDFKLGTDLSLLAGLNHPVVHGFNYSPPAAGFPGWVRFGTYLNQQNAWWPHFRRWTDYAARMGAVLRQSHHQADVAILAPRADEWARHGLLYQPFPEAAYPWYQYALATAVHQAGYGADFVSERVLRDATFQQGKLVYGPQRYAVLIVEEADAIEPETARALARFVAAGGRVVFAGRAPSRAPGLAQAESRDRAVRDEMTALLASAPQRVLVIPAPVRAEDPATVSGRGPKLTAATEKGLMTWASDALSRSGLQPFARFAPADPDLSHVHQRDGQRDIVFLANRSRDVVRRFTARFDTADKVPWVWDPETGARHPFGNAWPSGELAVELGPLESLLLVFEPRSSHPAEDPGPAAQDARIAPPVAPDRGGHPFLPRDPVAITGEWQLELRAAPTLQSGGASGTRRLATLVDLSRQDADPSLHDFGGVAVYRLAFDATDVQRTVLDLGLVHGVSEVWLNGQPLGVRWYGRHRFDVRGALRAGRNDLEVHVATVLANKMRSMRDNKAAQRWASWFPPIPTGLVGPVMLARPERP